VLEFIDSPGDVLALTIGGRITGDQLAQVTERLHRALELHDKVHIFVEVQSLESIELSNLASYVSDALPLFGKLHHFGRIAVVADQGWIRTATRVESTLLPGVGYRVVGPTERDEALAWVLGH
jgi:hypothetical protein